MSVSLHNVSQTDKQILNIGIGCRPYRVIA
jgi:hypothetical protein